jgi:hypothetical protein
VFDVAEYLLDESVGIIGHVKELPRDAGAPNFFYFYSEACNTYAFRSQKNFPNAGGASSDRGIAMARGKVFVGSDIPTGYTWTVTASHELLEMLADPDINLTAFVESTASSGVLYAYEVCDACEADEFGYKINGTLVSDFVFPGWVRSATT